MIWIIAGFFAFVAMTIAMVCDPWNSWLEKLLMPVLVFLGSMTLSFLVLILVSAVVCCGADITYTEGTDTKIVALKDNQNVNGSFYIMGGYVDEDLYYYYAKKTEFGYKTEKVKSSDSYIKYTDGDAHIIEYTPEFTNNWVNLFAMPIVGNRYVIYCPEGTITNEFNIDLE